MPLSPRSRDSGIEFAVGWYLLALGIGLFIPRKGTGLYQVMHEGGNASLWGALIIASSCALVVASFSVKWKLRAFAVTVALICWAVLAFRFVDASLWGATLQCMFSVLLLNACLFNLIRVRP